MDTNDFLYITKGLVERSYNLVDSHHDIVQDINPIIFYKGPLSESYSDYF